MIFMNDILSCEEIKNFISEDSAKKIEILVLDKATSTNALVKERAVYGVGEGLFVVAGEQTEGRGRLGRSFYSPGGTGLYMSLLLKPYIKPEEATLITTAAAVSVCEALEAVGANNPQIKWVNDIFVSGKKVCGILTEASIDPQNGALDYAVLGVGINVYEPHGGFPADLKNTAGEVFTEKRSNLRNRIAAEFLNSFLGYYKVLSQKHHVAEYQRRCFVAGKNVNVIKGETVKEAKALGVTENCGLLVEFSDGERVILTSGEISIRVQS